MVKYLKFLNVGDFKTDELITEFGIKLKSFSQDFNTNASILGVNEPIDFLDASIVHIIHDIKIDLIALHALKNINEVDKDAYQIDLQDQDVAYSFFKQASEKKIVVSNYPRIKSFRKYWANVYGEFKMKAYLKYKKIKGHGENEYVKSTQSVIGHKILFESNYFNSLHTLLPLVKELQDNLSISYRYVLTRDVAYEYLRSNRIKDIELIHSIEFGKINIASLRSFADEFIQQCYPALATKYLKMAFFKVLLKNFQLALNIYQPLKRVILEYKPNALVLCTGSSVDARLLIQLAKNNGIPDFVLVHGLLWNTPVITFNNSTVKFVWSEYQAQMMMKYAPSVKSIVTGSPKHSAIKSKLDKGDQKRIIEDPYILYATTPPNNVLLGQRDYEILLKSFAEVSRQFENLKFVIKLHPSEVVSQVKSLLHQLDGIDSRVVILKEEDIYNLLYFAEMVMVVSSTAGFEAVYFEKPLVIYETEIKAFHYPFKNEIFVKVVNSTEGLVKAISDNISKETSGYSSDIKAKYFLDNPSATEDILNFIASGNSEKSS